MKKGQLRSREVRKPLTGTPFRMATLPTPGITSLENHRTEQQKLKRIDEQSIAVKQQQQQDRLLENSSNGGAIKKCVYT